MLTLECFPLPIRRLYIQLRDKGHDDAYLDDCFEISYSHISQPLHHTSEPSPTFQPFCREIASEEISHNLSDLPSHNDYRHETSSEHSSTCYGDDYVFTSDSDTVYADDSSQQSEYEDQEELLFNCDEYFIRKLLQWYILYSVKCNAANALL